MTADDGAAPVAPDEASKARVTLSTAECRELRLLVTSGPRSTFGTERFCRQGRLVALGLAMFVDDGSSVCCEVTETGRREHAGRLIDARRPPKKGRGNKRV